uniref:Uncharacterized protein n=1 Tax=Nelumbo nucifera TaxID=4432 RepID=A0A822YSP3_NELNU|nr:TPA_asm: hypothetical protein HUJ06_006312 [Nelumbo nucifera]
MARIIHNRKIGVSSNTTRLYNQELFLLPSPNLVFHLEMLSGNSDILSLGSIQK